MRSAIGGYFELELGKGVHYHKGALRLNTARNCFEYILLARRYKKVYIPYFTCEVILEPLKRNNIPYEFYPINENLEPIKLPVLSKEEAFLYTNYFGLKQQYSVRLSQHYGVNLILDNAQAFYASHIDGIDTFYSPRKFFGVADGAYLYTDVNLGGDLEQDVSYDRMSHLLKRADVNAEFGYCDFQENDNSLINQPIKKMSKLTEKILCSIDYKTAKEKRQIIYKELEKELKEKNLLKIEVTDEDTPMVYPFLIDKGGKLKQKLIEQRIYIPTYWNNVLEWTNSEWELFLVQNLIALPIHQSEILNIKKIWIK